MWNVFNVNSKNTRTMSMNFQQISRIYLVFPSVILSKQMLAQLMNYRTDFILDQKFNACLPAHKY